jgi:pimeloyl-ACP methyl ester carboxylesterase
MEHLDLVVGDFTFSARADGPPDGDLVLLLHGFPETSYEWRKQLPALAAAGYRAVAPDQRGYAAGARPVEVDAYRVELLAADVVGFADALGADRFHVVGHDWGGAVAWVVAGSHGHRLRTMTSVSTPHPAPMSASMAGGEQREKSSYMADLRDPACEDFFLAEDETMLRQFFGSGEFDADAAAEYIHVFSERAALTGGLNWYRANTGPDAFRAPLGPVTVPTMYVWSTGDPYLGREAAEATRAHCEGPYRFEVLEGVDHWIPEREPDVLNALLLDHFAGH